MLQSLRGQGITACRRRTATYPPSRPGPATQNSLSICPTKTRTPRARRRLVLKAQGIGVRDCPRALSTPTSRGGGAIVALLAFPNTERKDEAMIARFDHHPMLTALLALTTAVLIVVVITLSTLLITSAPATSPSSAGDGANAGAAAHAHVGAVEAHPKGMSAHYGF